MKMAMMRWLLATLLTASSCGSVNASEWSELFSMQKQLIKEMDNFNARCGYKPGQSGMTRECYAEDQRLKEKKKVMSAIRVAGSVTCEIVGVGPAHNATWGDESGKYAEGVTCVSDDDELYQVSLISPECDGLVAFTSHVGQVRLCFSEQIFVGDRVTIKGEALSVGSEVLVGEDRPVLYVGGGEFGGRVELQIEK